MDASRRENTTYALWRLVPLLLLLLLPAVVACRYIAETPALTFSPEALPAAEVGRAYTRTITISSTLTPVLRVSVVAGELPPGLVLSHDAGNGSAVIGGTAEQAGRYAFTLEVECYGIDRRGQLGRHDYVIVTITPAQELVRAGTQLALDAIDIGVGNIWEEEYTDESGAERTGLTTGIWISWHDEREPEQFRRAHPGQEIVAGDLRILVAAVGRDGYGDYAVLQVSRQ